MDPLAERRRDEEFTVFVQTHGPALLRTARYLCADVQLAEDLVQVTLTKTFLAWRAARRGEPYLYARRVLVNSNIDRWRRRRWREQSTDDIDSAGDPEVQFDCTGRR